MRTLFLVGLVLGIVILFSPTLTMAQFSNLTENSATIDSLPRFPEPGETVELSLNAYSIDTTGSSISWFVDGIEKESDRNNRSIKITAGELGVEQSVVVRIINRNGVTQSITRKLKPSRIDTIVEANTLVPAFYKGRALPSAGSNVRVIALPAFGDNSTPQNYSYLWRLNNQVLQGGAVRGKNVIEFTAPAASNSTLSVDVIDSSGETVASESIIIDYVEPELYFYTDNPLRGMSALAIQNEHFLVGDEVDVRAEPYYMSVDIFSKKPLLEWSIDNSPISNPNPDQQTITLRKNGLGGSFDIAFHIRNLTELLQGVKKSFSLTF